MPVTAQDLDQEATFIGGVAADGTVAAESYWSWNGAIHDHLAFRDQSKAAKWGGGAAGTPGSLITYAFDGASNWSAAERDIFRSGMALWSSIADVHFQEGAQGDTGLLIRRDHDGTAQTNLWSFSVPVGGTQLTDMNPAINPNERVHGKLAPIVLHVDTGIHGWDNLPSFHDGGGYGVATVVHELGHVLGLGHGAAVNQAIKGANLDYPGHQYTAFDAAQWTIMSYVYAYNRQATHYDQNPYRQGVGTVPAKSGGVFYNTSTTPGMVDVIAAQRLYGAARDGALSGGQTFGFNATVTGAARPFFDFTVNRTPLVTLFSTGRGNTLDLSGFAQNSQVDLRPGTFSSAGGQTNNIGIALGTAIDRAVGGAGNDTFVLNGSGNAIEGGGGEDTVVAALSIGRYAAVRDGASLLLEAGGAVDRLSSINHLSFAEGTVALGQDPLIDDVFYAQTNDDVLKAGRTAERHYAENGWREERNPNAFFATKAYLAVNGDVAGAGKNPLTHYDQSGWQEGRDPSAQFSTGLYLRRNEDVAEARIDPLAHFLAHGQAEGRLAAPVIDAARLQGGFDPSFYRLANPDVATDGMDPLRHWQEFGIREGRDPNAFFDTRFYRAHLQAVADPGLDPFQHYLETGWKEGRDPSERFDAAAYLAHNADVAAAVAAGTTNPLMHFLQFGAAEGRDWFSVPG